MIQISDDNGMRHCNLCDSYLDVMGVRFVSDYSQRYFEISLCKMCAKRLCADLEEAIKNYSEDERNDFDEEIIHAGYTSDQMGYNK